MRIKKLDAPFADLPEVAQQYYRSSDKWQGSVKRIELHGPHINIFITLQPFFWPSWYTQPREHLIHIWKHEAGVWQLTRTIEL